MLRATGLHAPHLRLATSTCKVSTQWCKGAYAAGASRATLGKAKHTRICMHTQVGAQWCKGAMSLAYVAGASRAKLGKAKHMSVCMHTHEIAVGPAHALVQSMTNQGQIGASAFRTLDRIDRSVLLGMTPGRAHVFDDARPATATNWYARK